MRMSNFGYLVRRGVGSVFRNAMMSVASFCVLLVSLLLIGLSVLIAMDINIIMTNIEEKNEISVYVSGDLSAEQLSHISDVISANPNTMTGGVVYYSKEQAWKDQQEKLSDYAQLFEYLDENPMPDTFRVTVSDVSRISDTAAEFRSIEGVERVDAPYDFARAMVNIRATLSVIALGLLGVMIVTSVIIVYNAIRSSVFARAKEINIMKVVGATNAFVKIPFFIEGMFIGIAAGAAAWGLTKVIYEVIIQLFEDDITIWRIFGLVNIVQFDSITWYLLAADCVLGALLGAIGTIISTGKYVKV